MNTATDKQFSYEKLYQNRDEACHKRQQRYSFVYETQAEAEQALIEQIESAYQNGNRSIWISGIHGKHVDKVLKKFQNAGLEHIGRAGGGMIYFDNRSCITHLTELVREQFG